MRSYSNIDTYPFFYSHQFYSCLTRSSVHNCKLESLRDDPSTPTHPKDQSTFFTLAPFAQPAIVDTRRPSVVAPTESKLQQKWQPQSPPEPYWQYEAKPICRPCFRVECREGSV